MNEITDKVGRIFYPGCKVVRATIIGNSAYLEWRTVREIKNGKLFLDNSNTPIRRTDNLLVWD